jgi:predicted GNAT superfamily acetyltransferase
MDPSSIDIRPLTSSRELEACVDLQRATWGETFTDVVPISILKVSQRVGGVSAGAFDAAGTMLGFVFGLTGVERGRIVHWSDMLAVRPEARNSGLAQRLKDYQRRVVRDHGAGVIYWTYDPLIARNAHLNFNRLGVRLAEYAVDMYGVTDSVLHGGLPTDRLIVAWPTDDDAVRANLDESHRTLSSKDCLRAPVVTPQWLDDAAAVRDLPAYVRIEIPLDAERLFARAPEAAREWRLGVRRGLQWALDAGYAVSAFYLDDATARGYYLMHLIDRPQPSTGGGRQ